MQWKKRDPERKKLDKGWHLKFAWVPTEIYSATKPYGAVKVWLEYYWRRRSKHHYWTERVRDEIPDEVKVTHTRCGDHVTDLR